LTLTFGSAGLTTLKKLEESGGKLDPGSTDKTHVGLFSKDSLEQFSRAAQRKLTDSARVFQKLTDVPPVHLMTLFQAKRQSTNLIAR